MLDQALHSAAVIGAAGKMGSGISLLLLQEMARLELAEKGTVGTGAYTLTLIDPNREGLPGLRNYLRAQMIRIAERQINELRKAYADNPRLVSNEEIIQAYVQGAMDIVRFEEDLEQAKRAHLVFEAVVEDLDVKSKVFATLRNAVSQETLFFTNTSSIPIEVLSRQSGLENQLIGYHFYNPPAVQRLLEIIPSKGNSPEFIALAEELAKRLGKIAVISKDVAGFVGNGHFLREIKEALHEVEELEKEHTQVEAICLVDQMTRELLLRPMGIFQLFDYVGIDVLHRVMQTMTRYLDLSFPREMIDSMIEVGRLGGQHPDGSQKDGFFKYQGHKIEKVYSLEKQEYVDLPGNLIGEMPEGHHSWKTLSKHPERNERMKAYFENLFQMTTPAARLAQRHLYHSREIARQLVSDGVARSVDDVNTVIMNGFFHLYGPECQWIPEEAVR
jgi:3-hydroxyacyl-CoA dehydrogenase